MATVKEERIKRNNPDIEAVTGLYDRDTRQRRRAAIRAEHKRAGVEPVKMISA